MMTSGGNNSNNGNERELGRIIEQLDQGKLERAHLSRRLDEAVDGMGQVREGMAAMRVEFMMMNQRAEQASLLGARVSVIEGRLGSIASDLQTLKSFIQMAKSWSIKTVIGLLLGLSFGGAAFSKVIDLVFGFHWPMLK